MRDMSLIMKEAHKMTKEIKAEYPEVDYKFQLGLCISYLLKGDTEEKITWEVVEKNLDEAVEELGATKWDCNDWKKGDIDRTYITIYTLYGKHYRRTNCGYWDNVKEEYVPFVRNTVVYDVLNREEVVC